MNLPPKQNLLTPEQQAEVSSDLYTIVDGIQTCVGTVCGTLVLMTIIIGLFVKWIV